MELIFDCAKQAIKRHFLQERNKRIVARYYYHNKVHERPNLIALQLLSDEFCLSVDTVSGIIRKNKNLLNELKNEQCPIEVLKNEYYWLVWENA